MPESIAQRTNGLACLSDKGEMRQILGSVLTDLAVLRASIVGITAKLDADATVTDTNYGALQNPAALNTVL